MYGCKQIANNIIFTWYKLCLVCWVETTSGGIKFCQNQRMFAVLLHQQNLRFWCNLSNVRCPDTDHRSDFQLPVDRKETIMSCELLQNSNKDEAQY